MIKKAFIGLAVFILVLFVFFQIAQETLVSRLMERVIERNFQANILDELPDGLHVLLCGSGSPMPDPTRAGPCTAVIAGEQLYIVDTGAGASKNLSLFKVPQGEIDAVLLTHFHSDHIDGLGELTLQRWVNGLDKKPLTIYGPSGVEQVVRGFNDAYAQDDVYRITHHGAETLIAEGNGAEAFSFTQPEPGELKKVLAKERLTISALKVDHQPVDPAVGYRFDYKGRSLVISGDTSKSKNLEQLSQNVDLLLHDSLNPELVDNLTKAARKMGNKVIEKISIDILDYHASPVEAAEIARDANIKHLVFTHVVPPLPFPPMEKVFVKGVDEVYSGGVTVGRDGMLISLKTNSDSIKVSQANSFISP